MLYLFLCVVGSASTEGTRTDRTTRGRRPGADSVVRRSRRGPHSSRRRVACLRSVSRRVPRPSSSKAPRIGAVRAMFPPGHRRRTPRRADGHDPVGGAVGAASSVSRVVLRDDPVRPDGRGRRLRPDTRRRRHRLLPRELRQGDRHRRRDAPEHGSDGPVARQRPLFQHGVRASRGTRWRRCRCGSSTWVTAPSRAGTTSPPPSRWRSTPASASTAGTRGSSTRSSARTCGCRRSSRTCPWSPTTGSGSAQTSSVTPARSAPTSVRPARSRPARRRGRAPTPARRSTRTPASANGTTTARAAGSSGARTARTTAPA